MSSFTTLLHEIEQAVKPIAATGKVANYIPELAKVPSDSFAFSISQLAGASEGVGQVDTAFSIQSISKTFLLALALQEMGEALWHRLGREPSGNPFNSLVQLEKEHGVPRNPFINAGALVVCDVLLGLYDDPLLALQQWLSEESGSMALVDPVVAQSEIDHSDRNASLVHFMRSYGRINHRVDRVLEFYCRACAISMSTTQLANTMLVLANHGSNPISGKTRFSRSEAKRINAVMLTCGTYDAAGEFAYRVGLPCKSGVGGGIVAVIPNKMGLCVWSPPLDVTGNSAAGLAALDMFTTKTGLSIF